MNANNSVPSRNAFSIRVTQICLGLALTLASIIASAAPPPPVNLKRLKDEFGGNANGGVKPPGNVGNHLSLDQIAASIKQEGDVIVADLTDVTTLLNEQAIIPTNIYGKVYIGPYPFDAAHAPYVYKRFGSDEKIKQGRATLPIESLFIPKENSEGWKTGGNLAVRLILFLQQDGADKALGTYDTFVSFKTADQKTFTKLPTILEGPLMHQSGSEHPGRITISLRTDVKLPATVVIENSKKRGKSPAGNWHEIVIDGLRANTEYRYHVVVGETRTRSFGFKTAPMKGHGKFRFAYLGDSRSGDGGGLQNLMGVNHEVLEKLIPRIYFGGAEFMLMGGDMITGYTQVEGDFVTQLRSWKQAMAGFWSERPVYTAMGNHEALLRVYEDNTAYGVGLDKWSPETMSYDDVSGEAILAREFVQPSNGPADPKDGRPAYSENVYSFQRGNLKVIVFNNNYWVFTHKDKVAQKWKKYGGSPEGYVMDDQLDWIKRELALAENDSSVEHIVLMAQEPVFPNSAHMSDAMWWHGDNSVRAYMFDENGNEIWIGRKPATDKIKGVIDVRNELVEAVCASTKVAAVLCSDEHVYHRTLVGPETPIGDVAKDTPEDGTKIVWTDTVKPSPLTTLKHRVWFIVCGGGGAPYAGELKSPWNEWWKAQPNPERGYKFISQENICLFDVDGEKISLIVLTAQGQVIDRIDNLRAAKDPKRPVGPPTGL